MRYSETSGCCRASVTQLPSVLHTVCSISDQTLSGVPNARIIRCTVVGELFIKLFGMIAVFSFGPFDLLFL